MPNYTFSPAAFNREVSRALFHITRNGVREAKRLAPKDTNELVNSMRAEQHGHNVRVIMSLYGWYQERGTGLYGPHRQYITPRRAPYLVWAVRTKDVARGKYPGKQAGDLVFAKRVKGLPARHFLERGLKIALREFKRRV